MSDRQGNASSRDEERDPGNQQNDQRREQERAAANVQRLEIPAERAAVQQLLRIFDNYLNVTDFWNAVNTVQTFVLREHEGENLTDNQLRQLVMERLVELVPEQRWNQLYADIVVYVRLLRRGASNGALRPYP